MLDPVVSDVRNLNYFVDWVELSAMLDPDGTISQTDVARAAQASGLITGDPSDIFETDESYSEESDLADDDPQRNFAEQIWEVLWERSQWLAHQYPFELERDSIARRGGAWTETPSYMMSLLLSQLIQYRGDGELTRVGGHSFRRLFEKMVEAASSGLFRGTTVRVGSPHEADLPTHPVELVHALGDRFHLEVENLTGKVNADDKDMTVDVISRLRLGDEEPGTLIVLLQCASGRDWRKKRGEPTVGRWDDLLRWDAAIIGAVAVPFWLASRAERVRQFRHFGKNMLILDRPRLMTGSPDDSLDGVHRLLIVRWCEAQARRLPSA